MLCVSNSIASGSCLYSVLCISLSMIYWNMYIRSLWFTFVLIVFFVSFSLYIITVMSSVLSKYKCTNVTTSTTSTFGIWPLGTKTENFSAQRTKFCHCWRHFSIKLRVTSVRLPPLNPTNSWRIILFIHLFFKTWEYILGVVINSPLQNMTWLNYPFHCRDHRWKVRSMMECSA